MKSTHILLVSISAFVGAAASGLAVRFFSKRRLVDVLPSVNGVEDHAVADPFNPSKRQGYLSWDDYFMAIAFLSAKRSKDPNSVDLAYLSASIKNMLENRLIKFEIKVGACLVSQNDVILGIGYNGFPRGCSDDKLPWAKKSMTGNTLETKYPYVCHAEVNAILNTNHASAAGQKLYVTMFPCNECAKIIIQSGVTEVIYFIEKLSKLDTAYIASQKLLSMAGIKVRKHQPQMSHILIHFEQA